MINSDSSSFATHTGGPTAAVRRQPRWAVWLRRLPVGALLVIVAVALIGFVYQTLATNTGARMYPPPGQRVAVGGYSLHIVCAGVGSPTVILEGALPSTSAHWAWVQPEVAQTTRMCAYDRAGYRWSDAGPEPRDSRQIARELHALLTNAGIRGPYVLVGHSMGGLHVRMYTTQYPDEVAGLVLVDASHPSQWTRLPAEVTGAVPSDGFIRVAMLLARLGVTRAFGLVPAPADLPTAQHAQVKSFVSSTQHMAANGAELRAIPQSNDEVWRTGSLGARPLVVLSAPPPSGVFPANVATRYEQSWMSLQQELVALSSHSVQRVVDDATHDSLVYERNDSRATVAAIVQVVEAIRTGQRLVP